MSNEIDLDQFIQVLDHALATDDKNVRKALKKFLFVAALALEDDPEPGPFTQMLDEMDSLRKRVRDLETANQDTQKFYQDDYWTNTNTSGGTPYWKYLGGSSTSGTVTVNPTTTTTGATSITSGGSSCTGFTVPTTTTNTWSTLGYTINLGDDEKGKRIKEELQQKLGSLTKSA